LRKELKITSLIVSHDVSSVFRVADRIAFLHKGALTFTGTPSEFANSTDPSINEMVQKAQAVSF
jgi:phospholipid/cholesterol/gamma-HCH transport system ATP-binding protein